MNTDEAQMLSEEDLNALSSRILNAAFAVSNVLGSGFKEKVYENALYYELRKRGMDAQKQVPIQVFYDGVVVGDFVADVLVEGTILLELKAADAIHPEFIAQALNYLNATHLPLCLILNFGTPRIGIKRVRL